SNQVRDSYVNNRSTNLQKSGAGTMVLSGANVYTGTTTVSAGTLAINGDSSAATGDVGVSGSGTRLIGSNGTVGGNTTINSGAIHSAGGAIANSNKVGKQTFDQAAAATTNLTYGAGSIFEWDLNAKKDTDSGARGIDYDAVDVTGALVVNSTAIFRVVLGTGATTGDLSFWQQNQTWSDIFSGGFSGSASFTSSLLQVVDAASGATFDVSNLNSGIGSGFTISGSNLNWTAVPEPTSALAGLLITAGLLRRRRNA
ncbi:MAG: autotransporter-associated beta strand repeat-containing protein, partial [Luteolibacter sp.]